MSELLPCPFCQMGMVKLKDEHGEFYGHSRCRAADQKRCFIDSLVIELNQIESWNSRAAQGTRESLIECPKCKARAIQNPYGDTFQCIICHHKWEVKGTLEKWVKIQNEKPTFTGYKKIAIWHDQIPNTILVVDQDKYLAKETCPWFTHWQPIEPPKGEN